MHFYANERVALFIDGANLYATSKALGFDIDYKRLLSLFRQKCQLVRALYYTALAEDQEYSSIRPLIDWLDYNGFSMVTKPTKEFTDASGRRKIKGNMDIELAVDAMRLADNLDMSRIVLRAWMTPAARTDASDDFARLKNPERPRQLPCFNWPPAGRTSTRKGARRFTHFTPRSSAHRIPGNDCLSKPDDCTAPGGQPVAQTLFVWFEAGTLYRQPVTATVV